MDGVYDKLWDVTVLEYAVSMHTRRGDHSRKKLALEKVQTCTFRPARYIQVVRLSSLAKFLFEICGTSGLPGLNGSGSLTHQPRGTCQRVTKPCARSIMSMWRRIRIFQLHTLRVF